MILNNSEVDIVAARADDCKDLFKSELLTR